MTLGPGSFDSFGIPQSRPGTLDDLDDVDTAEAKDGETIVRRNGRWVPGVASGGTSGGGGGENEVEISDVEPEDLGIELWVDPDGVPPNMSHGMLLGLQNDDHPQYLTQARADVLYLSPGEVPPPVTDHGVLTGLGDDDHPQYLTQARADAAFLTPAEVLPGTNVTVDRTTTPGSVIIAATPASSGVTDHGALTGLADNDHPQYVKKIGDLMTGSLGIQLPPVSGLLSVGHNLHTASFRAPTSPMTGVILIEFPPVQADLPMSLFTIRGYDYTATSGAWQVEAGGYMYQPTRWERVSARSEGLFPGGKRSVRVRFNSKVIDANTRQFSIAIGESNTVWTYPQVLVESITGHAGAGHALLPGTVISITPTALATLGWTIDHTVYSDTPFTPALGEIRTFTASTQSIANNTTVMLTGIAVSSGDTGNGAISLSGDTFTLNETGFYDFNFNVGWDSNSTGVRVNNIMANGSTAWRNYGPATGPSTMQTAVVSAYHSAGTDITFRVLQTSGAALNMDGAKGSLRLVQRVNS